MLSGYGMMNQINKIQKNKDAYVGKEEIEKNDYNLSVSTYVEKEDTREVIAIKVLNKEIAETVRKIDVLRASINEIVKEMDDGE